MHWGGRTILAAKLVDLIEKHAEDLTRKITHHLQTDPHTPTYHSLSPEKDHERVFDVVSRLGLWLDTKSEAATESVYRKLGRQRFREGIPLAEVVYALMLTKQTLRQFVLKEGWVNSTVELYQLAELYNLTSSFFDRAVYFTALSYQEEARPAGKFTARASPPGFEAGNADSREASKRSPNLPMKGGHMVEAQIEMRRSYVRYD